MISLEKWLILTPLQKLHNNVGNLGKIIFATGSEWLAKVQKIAQYGHTDYYPQNESAFESIYFNGVKFVRCLLSDFNIASTCGIYLIMGSSIVALNGLQYFSFSCRQAGFTG